MRYSIFSILFLSIIIFSCSKKKFERKIENNAWVCVEQQLTSLGELNYDTTNIAFFKLYVEFNGEGKANFFAHIDDNYDTTNYRCFINNSLKTSKIPVGEEVRFDLEYEFREDLPNVFRLDSVELEIRQLDNDELWLRTFGGTTATEFYRFEKVAQIP